MFVSGEMFTAATLTHAAGKKNAVRILALLANKIDLRQLRGQ